MIDRDFVWIYFPISNVNGETDLAAKRGTRRRAGNWADGAPQTVDLGLRPRFQ